MYPVVWRWHFYAGLFVAPVLIATALTGALLIFQDELEYHLYPHLLFVTPRPERVSYEKQLAAAQAFAPEDTVVGCAIDPDPLRATAVFVRTRTGGREVFVDPYTGLVLGDEAELRFFENVLNLHRRLFVGAPGNLVVELTTCWTIVLLLSGAYLWWPRRRGQIWGVWLPRLRAHPYVVLRDLHAVAGLYAWCVALTITCTGLVYAKIWGSGYGLAAMASQGFTSWKPSPSHSSAQAANLPVDEVVAIAQRNLPDTALRIFLPDGNNGATVVMGARQMYPVSQRVLVLDRATGEMIEDRSSRDAGALAWWRTWNYSLHVGSVLGTPTKVIWLMACLALIVLPVTGVWMWLQRRPSRQSGFPAKPSQQATLLIRRIILVLCIVLPMFGLSVVAILWGEGAVRRRIEARAARDRVPVE
jgi:uncharacterized iron-regulated membrane protein